MPLDAPARTRRVVEVRLTCEHQECVIFGGVAMKVVLTASRIHLDMNSHMFGLAERVILATRCEERDSQVEVLRCWLLDCVPSCQGWTSPWGRVCSTRCRWMGVAEYSSAWIIAAIRHAEGISMSTETGTHGDEPGPRLADRPHLAGADGGARPLLLRAFAAR